MSHALGQHLLAELHGCPANLLNDVAALENLLIEAAHKAGATVINTTFHHFSPFGVSGVVVIQESHLAIHTWPEQGFAAIDLFTCGDQTRPGLACTHLKHALQSTHGEIRQLKRGQISQAPNLPPATPAPTDPVHNLWFTQRDKNIALSLRHTGVISQTQSEYQKIEILDTYGYGRMLVLDGQIMCTERDECVYHEMIAHVPALLHPNPQHALIIGGGDGGAARELCRHHNLETITIVEIDAQVVETSRLYLPTLAAGFTDPRVELHTDNGISFIQNCADSTYDLILIDAQGADELISEPFYTHIRRCLTSTGILVAQISPPVLFDPVFAQTIGAQQSAFGALNIHPYTAFIPTYATGMLCFSLATKNNRHPIDDFQIAHASEFAKKHPLQYYTPEIHTACFALPPFVKNMIGATS
ncbi:MAG: polyamine aminopropyltransferase [Candidatus Latescibacteria bacterium]|nr:polyamine aminopropyltransferase [Candidatus Latescibacterota bacterium]